jgi:hypothetical protein
VYPCILGLQHTVPRGRPIAGWPAVGLPSVVGPNVTAGPRPAFSTAVGLPLVVESQI